jgi:hypothetical protein
VLPTLVNKQQEMGLCVALCGACRHSFSRFTAKTLSLHSVPRPVHSLASGSLGGELSSRIAQRGHLGVRLISQETQKRRGRRETE